MSGSGVSRARPLAWILFLRMLALVHVAGTAALWFYMLGGPTSLIGLEVPAFDALSLPTTTVLAVLAVLYPLVAIGLWTLNAGGQVLWAGAAALQLVGFSLGLFAPLPVWPIAVAIGVATAFFAGAALLLASRRVTTA